jgi:putative heme-binding domain-containing protein
VKFGTASAFPEPYRRAFFAMDWSYGRILAVHLEATNATYTGRFENFVAPASLHAPGPKATLNVTDLEFGRDGAMYFLTGGRGTQSGLYRVSFKGAARPPSEGARKVDERLAEARRLRHKLESFHGKKDPAAVAFAWPHLNSEDRWTRYAARIAIESQPVAEWQERALKEERVNAGLTALLALARLGSSDVQGELLDSLDRLGSHELTEAQGLEALRVLSLSVIRMGKPSADVAADIVQRLDAHYPAATWPLNRELCQLMIYLEAPSAAAKTLRLLDSATTQEEQIHYLFHLRTLKTGWTVAERRRYLDSFDRDWKHGHHPEQVLRWFADAGRDYDNGASFPKFIAHFRKDAMASLSDQERVALASFMNRPALTTLAPANAAPRPFVREWKTAELLPAVEQLAPGRNLEKGRQAFAAAQCAACHRFNEEGGSVGPDLTAVTSRFAPRDILESIMEPSKVVSEQYQNTTVFKKDGDDVTGRIVEDTAEKLVIVTNPLTQDKVEVRKADVRDQTPSRVSPMPEGLLNSFQKEEILDLLAYIESGGKQQRAAAGQ